jgi:hypothetical protein
MFHTSLNSWWFETAAEELKIRAGTNQTANAGLFTSRQTAIPDVLAERGWRIARPSNAATILPSAKTEIRRLFCKELMGSIDFIIDYIAGDTRRCRRYATIMHV